MRIAKLSKSRTPRALGTPPTPTGGGKLWRLGVQVTLAVGMAMLMTSVALKPSKRNIEVLAGVVFLALVLIAHPFKALLFTVFVVPFPAHTSVGTTSSLLIFALSGLVMVKSRMLRLPSPFVQKEADWAIGGFLLTMLLSLYQQDFSEPAPIREFLTGMFSAVALYYVVIQLAPTVHHLARILVATQAVAFLLAIIANLQALFPNKPILPEFFKFSRRVAEMEEVRRGEIRAFATFNGYEMFAEYCAIGVILQYFLWRRSKTMPERAFWIVSICVTLLALFRTATRGGIIILVFGAAYALWMGARAIPRGQMMRVVFVGLAAFYLSLPFMYDQVGLMFERMSTIGADDSSVQSRSKVMEQALSGIPDSPFLGHGIYQPPGHFRGGVTQHIHSLYVTLAYKMGIPNLICFVWLLTVVFRLSWRHARDPAADPAARELMLALHVTLVMWIVDQVKIEFTRSALNMHIAWLHIAMTMALASIMRKQSASQL